MTCPARRKGVDCAFSAPDDEGVHPEIHSPRHGGTDRRGIWHFWGTTMTASELAAFSAAVEPATPQPALPRPA
jgi:hypothetical protein